jgi:hypothetical protein
MCFQVPPSIQLGASMFAPLSLVTGEGWGDTSLGQSASRLNIGTAALNATMVKGEDRSGGWRSPTPATAPSAPRERLLS